MKLVCDTEVQPTQFMNLVNGDCFVASVNPSENEYLYMKIGDCAHVIGSYGAHIINKTELVYRVNITELHYVYTGDV